MSHNRLDLTGEVFDTVEEAIADIAGGRMVVVADDENRENEGDIVFAASKATPELMNFAISRARGLVCVPMLGEDLDRLRITQMTSDNHDRMGTAFTVSVDATHGVTTGISAADRSRTARVLADSKATADDLVRPGHMFPLRYTEGGVLKRRGHTEAAIDLVRLAGLTPVSVIAEVINDDGTMARLGDLRKFAAAYGLKLISIAQLVEYRRAHEQIVERTAVTTLPNKYGGWRAFGYLNAIDNTEHIALVLGDIGDGEGVLTRVHSECLTGDVLGSARCECGQQLDASMRMIQTVGRGVIVYVRGHEGRGIGLVNKLRAYALQDGGIDTVDANLALGLPIDDREYSSAAQILKDLDVRSVRLLSNNPDKVAGISSLGIAVTERVAIEIKATKHNLGYLQTKRDRLGHQLTELPLPIGKVSDQSVYR